MSIFSDETLMAFADDELDADTRAAVTEAMRDNPDIERQIARHRAMRVKVRLAYSAELEQRPPERLLAAARGQTGRAKASVTDLATARAAGTARAADTTHALRPPPRWQTTASMAASVLVGVALGYFALHRSDTLVARPGGWVAGGPLAMALSGQLGGDGGSDSAVHVGLSFVAKSGDYCRVFTLSAAGASAGVACRGDDAWQIRVLAQAGPEGSAGAAANDARHDAYRTAGSPLSPVVLDAVQSQIVGEPLDREGEIKARAQGWRPTGQ